MLLVTSNRSKRLLWVSYIGQVRPEEFRHGREDFKAQLQELTAGFRLLADFTSLEFMRLDCEPELGRMMELTGAAGVELVVRVIPDPSKDIGMNILTAFHYPHPPRVVTCQNLIQAARALDL